MLITILLGQMLLVAAHPVWRGRLPDLLDMVAPGDRASGAFDK